MGGNRSRKCYFLELLNERQDINLFNEHAHILCEPFCAFYNSAGFLVNFGTTNYSLFYPQINLYLSPEMKLRNKETASSPLINKTWLIPGWEEGANMIKVYLSATREVIWLCINRSPCP